MKIGIDAQRLFRRKKFGMDIAVYELIRNLEKIDQTNEYVVYVAPGADHCINETTNFTIRKIKNKLYPVWEQFLLPIVVSKMKIDLLHCTANTAPIWCKKPMILTLHDTISLEHNLKRPKTFYQNFGNMYRKFLIPHIVRKAKHLITVSETEKQNIVRMLHVSPDFVTVVHNGVDNKRYQPVTDPQTQDAFRKKYQLPERYIAFIGNTDPRKNVDNTLRAYADYLEKSDKKRKLVILHNKPKAFESSVGKLRLNHLKENIRLLGYIESEDMPAFYSLAEMFLYPSLREGFGIPVLEAMACGTPVITSNVSAMPEVGGDAALYVSPVHYQEITERMLYLEIHPEIRKKMIEAGFEQCKILSWDDAAQKVLNVYQKVFEQLKHL